MKNIEAKPCRFAQQCSEEGSCVNGCEDRAPIAYLRAITHPDWLEVCQKDEPGAFPVFAAYKLDSTNRPSD